MKHKKRKKSVTFTLSSFKDVRDGNNSADLCWGHSETRLADYKVEGCSERRLGKGPATKATRKGNFRAEKNERHPSKSDAGNSTNESTPSPFSLARHRSTSST